MNQHPLQVVATDTTVSPNSPRNSKTTRRQEIQATMERLWLQEPQQFDPNRDSIQRQRIATTADTIRQSVSLQGKRVADLGCGAGTLTRLLRDEGATIDAVDIAGNALQRLKEGDMTRINAIQDCLPTSRLADDAYDVVVCSELIGYLHPNEYRLLFAELSRVVKSNGTIVCSTSFDLNTEEAIQLFASLAETELAIDRWVVSYHRLLIRCLQFFEAPGHFTRGWKDHNYRREVIEKLSSKKNWTWWYRMNSSRLLGPAWWAINWLTKPAVALLKNNAWIRDQLEKISKLLWSKEGISFAMLVGKRRPLAFPLPADEIPLEPKQKRLVWE